MITLFKSKSGPKFVCLFLKACTNSQLHNWFKKKKKGTFAFNRILFTLTARQKCYCRAEITNEDGITREVKFAAGIKEPYTLTYLDPQLELSGFPQWPQSAEGI